MSNRPHLKRALGLYATTSIVIGSVVGSGIFSSPSSMARDLPSAPWLLGGWLFTGLLTLCGALTQSELVGQIPRTGGLYEYFREIYGERMSFLYGWANFMIAGSGAIAAIAMFFAVNLYVLLNSFGLTLPLPEVSKSLAGTPVHLPFLGDIFPFQDLNYKIIGSLLVILLTYLNIRGVKLGATVQSISTTSKILAILIVVGIAFFAGSQIGSTVNWSSVTSVGSGLSGWSLINAITLAMAGAFWAYDGWGNCSYIAGEVKTPQKTIPRALILGTLTFVSLYIVVNLAYFYILSVEGVGGAPGDAVASTMVGRVLGGTGGALIALLIMLSTFDTTNSSVLTNARVYFAMAEHKIFYKKAAAVHPRFQTPHIALLLQGLWSLVLLNSGSFGLITSMYVFVNWLLYVMMGLGVFILRRRRPHAERPFKVPGYPIIPGIFVVFAFSYVVLTLIGDIKLYNEGKQDILQSVTGIVLVLTGLPFYYYWKNKRGVEAEEQKEYAPEPQV